jgi:hypothetical protein
MRIAAQHGAAAAGPVELQLRGIARQQGIYLAYVGELLLQHLLAQRGGAGAMVIDVVLLLDLAAHRAAAVATGDQS